MARQAFVDLLDKATASGTAVANTAAETILFPTYSIPTNYLQDGRTLVFVAYGQYSNTGTPTMVFSLRLGGVAGTLICKSPAITTPSGVTAAVWKVEVFMTVRSNGATGTIMGNGTSTVFAAVAGTVGSATGAAAVQPMTAGGVTTPAVATVDFTAAQAFALTLTWSAADASNTATGLNQGLLALN